MFPKLHRMWINAPSEFQPVHHLHGRKVLAHMGEYPYRDKVVVVYPITGVVQSFRLDRMYLSKGWPDDKV